MARKKRDPKSVELANRIIAEYAPESVEDMENALKDVFGPMFEAMLQGEMNNHLGYSSNDKSDKITENRRNGYGNKTLNTTKGNIEINVPRDRDASFEPQLIKKRQRDVSEIEDKVISMYAKGMSQRDISSTIEDIYGFSVSHEMISDITDAVIPEMEEWQTRPLEKCYTFVFVDCLYTKIRTDYEIKEYAVYTILGYTIDGKKQILGLWLNETESKHKWMQIFDEIKARGVEDIFFLSMDGVSGLESGVKAIFPKTIVQRCIVHLVRNSIKYVPSKDYKAFTSSLRKVYGATSLKACHTAFEAFKQQWSQYPGAVDVWKRNFTHVEQLFDYGSNIRKIMYTTNAVESIHSSYRKVTKKGAFPNENALLKLLFIRTKELQKKWSTGYIPNWSMVMNQLLLHDQIKDRVIKYLE
ncbi:MULTISPECIES: IS256 family transposase [Staphylococcaceae]|nr:MULTISPECIES: IS256 family transposase [Mammaliicoccus]MCS5428365.1 IS256 family transposase [Staphylococcus aureus]MEB8131839.1 IS256 family transposase [Mammaliicoccus sciuri]QQC96304.1 IS256 family transposase [Mammaliicoccus sciuri]RXY90084.1 IS256 family transposase [Salmonella sp. 3DZ2-4SM]